jgi:hypothetical protein
LQGAGVFVGSHVVRDPNEHPTADQEGERRGLAPPPIRYEWQNGEIVKRINSEVVEGLEGIRPSRSRWLSHGLMILGVMATLLAIGVLGYYRGCG